MVAKKIPCRSVPPSCGGFSLIELMIVIAIIVIAMAALVPSIRDFMSGQRVKSASLDLATAAMFARSEALKRGAQITVVAANGNDLSQGWCVIFGTGTASDCNLDVPGSKVMRLQQPLPNVTFAFVPSASAAPITFNSAGRLATAVNIEITDVTSTVDSPLVRCLIVDVSGSTRSKKGSCS